MLSSRSSDTAGQGPPGLFVVTIRLTVPAVISAALGVYVVERLVVLPKVPVPVEVHVTDEADPPMVAVTEAGVFEHIVWSGPALTVAGCPMVTSKGRDVLGQASGVVPYTVTV